jgi:hypothetical protein
VPGRYEVIGRAMAAFLDRPPSTGDTAGNRGSFDLSFMSAVRPLIPGDTNGDGAVNFADLLVLAQHYHLNTGQTVETGDFNNDGGVGFDDLLILAQHYGETADARPAASPAPEPAAEGAVVCCTAALAAGRAASHCGRNVTSRTLSPKAIQGHFAYKPRPSQQSRSPDHTPAPPEGGTRSIRRRAATSCPELTEHRTIDDCCTTG